MKLTEKMRAFCREYVVDFCGKKAAVRAGYSKRTAEAAACRMLKRVDVAEEVAALVAAAKVRNEVSIDRVLQEIMAIAFLDPAELFDEAGVLLPLKEMCVAGRRAISGFDVEERFEGGKDDEPPAMVRVRKVRLVNKDGALEKLAKHLQLYAPERVEHGIGGGASFAMVLHKGEGFTGAVREGKK